MSKPKKTKQTRKQGNIQEPVQESALEITNVLLGIGLLALTIYSGWIIFQAPETELLDLKDYLPVLQKKIGFLGSLIYVGMHGLMGNGMVLFPFIYCFIGISLLAGKTPSRLQMVGAVLAILAVLTMLHMHVAYVNIKDNLLLGLAGNGGGIIGAVCSMLLQKALGNVGAYIVLFSMAVFALLFLVQGAVFGRGEDFFTAVHSSLLRIKETLIQFLFIEEEIEEEGIEEKEQPRGTRTAMCKTETVSAQKVGKNKEKTVQLKEYEESVSRSNTKRGIFGGFFRKEEHFDEMEESRKRYASPEYVVIPKEKPVILNSLVEIHKALDEQEPRVGLSPREPLKQDVYKIADSMEAFQQLLDKREVNYTITTKMDSQKTDARKIEAEDDALEKSAQTEPVFKTTSEQKSKQDNRIAEETETVFQSDLGQPEATVSEIATSEETVLSGYQLPSIDLLDKNEVQGNNQNPSYIRSNVERLEKTLNDFGVKGKILNVSCGPAITQYEFQPAPGVKVSKIVGLSDDIALSMAVAGVRMEAPIPGKAAVGIEIPNKSTTMVGLRELIESDAFQNSKSKLTVALGKDISGNAIVADLAKMPHLLIAGSTGSGKSVCMNTLINSIIYKATSDEVKFVMIDPKKVELGNYNGIPHLISPVVTDAKKAAAALRWAVQEMDRRYEVFASNGVKDMPRFNKLSEERRAAAESEEEKASIEIMPYIVVLIDELADLMMVAPADVEDAICRLAQLARAAGIHLVVATQRPSVDVITGIIKANMPSRIAFAVSSQTDSRTILDMGGAEKLLGRGDMLFYPTGMPKPQRVQGVYVSDKEIDRITEAVKQQAQPIYNEEIGSAVVQTEGADSQEEVWDDLIPEATKLFIENGQASISLLQRRFRVGYNRAARIVDQMEQRGLVGPSEGSKPRQVRVTMRQYEDMLESGEL